MINLPLTPECLTAKFERSVSWLCWAYNEDELVYDFLLRANELLRQSVKDYEIIIVDDGSTDQTNEIIRSLQDKIPQMRLITNAVNLGTGISSQKAIQAASKEYFFWQTVDWSYDINKLRIFLELLKFYDIVQGVRREPVRDVDEKWRSIVTITRLFNMKHLTKRSDSIFKAVVSLINYMLIRVLFRVPLSDFQNVTFYPTSFIKSLKYEAKSSFVSPEGLIKAYWKKMRIIEVPISFIPRKAGVAKGVSIRSIKAALTDITKLWFKWIILGRRDFTGYGEIRRLKPEEWKIS